MIHTRYKWHIKITGVWHIKITSVCCKSLTYANGSTITTQWLFSLLCILSHHTICSKICSDFPGFVWCFEVSCTLIAFTALHWVFANYCEQALNWSFSVQPLTVTGRYGFGSFRKFIQNSPRQGEGKKKEKNWKKHLGLGKCSGSAPVGTCLNSFRATPSEWDGRENQKSQGVKTHGLR